MLVANLLSLSRVPLAGLVWVAPESAAWVLGVMAVAGVTDVLDGWVIRKWRARRSADGHRGAYAALVGRGAVIDGVADKIFVTSTVIALLVTVRPPVWVICLLLARELLFLPVGLAYRLAPAEVREKVDFTAGIPGKAATVVQFVALLLGFLRHPWFVVSAIAAGVLGGVAVVYYVGRTFTRRPRADDEGSPDSPSAG